MPICLCANGCPSLVIVLCTYRLTMPAFENRGVHQLY